jgi:spore germination protein GerM
VPRIKAVLFFASEDGRGLVGVEQEVALAEGTVPQARALVEAQLSTAPPPPLVSTIPEGTTLRGLFVSSRNEAFVDLDAAIRDRHPGGSMNELFTVYTIVNAVTTNLPDVQTVQVLIDGREVDTLAGHVDLRRPLRKNDALILP